MNVYLVYTLICENRAKIDGIKIFLVGDVPDAHLVLRAMTFRYDSSNAYYNGFPLPVAIKLFRLPLMIEPHALLQLS